MNFDIWAAPTKREVSAAKYWIDIELPGELINLNMQQLTALRKMVTKAFNEGKKHG